MIVEVAILGAPVRKTFDYIVPKGLRVSIGQRVVIDFSNRLVTGIVVAEKESSIFEDLKPIEDLVEPQVYLSLEDIQLAKITSNYFLSPIGKILEASFPPNMRFKIKEILIKRSEIVPGFLKGEISLSKEKFLGRFSDRKKGIRILSELLKKGLIDLQFSYSQHNVKPKVIKRIYLTGEIRELLRNRKISKKRLEIVNYLLLNDGPELSNLKKDLNLKNMRIIRIMEREGILKIVEEEVSDEQYFESYKSIILTKEQKEIVETIRSSKIPKHYLYGVTGSGKTEIYFELMEHILSDNRKVLYMVPEITLTPQIVSRIKARFSKYKVAVYHSDLKPKERFLEWLKIVNDDAQIVVGTRSSVWLPIKNLGLIVVDEEHDESYYQKDMEPVYDAVKVAEWKSELHNAMFIIGSATPNISRFFISKTKNFGIHHLRKRPDISTLPKVEIIDMRKEPRYNWIFSKRLLDEIEKVIKKGKQVFLFIHRKGFFSYIMCTNCGYVHKCKNCDVSMTYHRSIRSLKCHYCGNLEPLPSYCPICGSRELISRGFGTEKVEREILKIFPGVRVVRMDRDNIKKIEDLTEILEMIRDGLVDVVVGTKIIAKGLDFPNVTLVGIISAEQFLNFPDYTASEKTFEIINQVAGRSGRGAFEGKVILQTFNPESHVIKHMVNHDYFSFYEEEIRNRKKLNYPPFKDIINLMVENPSKEKATLLSENLFDLLNDKLKGELLGPVEALIFKLRNFYRYNLIVKTSELMYDLSVIRNIIEENSFWSNIKIFINPPNLF